MKTSKSDETEKTVKRIVYNLSLEIGKILLDNSYSDKECKIPVEKTHPFLKLLLEGDDYGNKTNNID